MKFHHAIFLAVAALAAMSTTPALASSNNTTITWSASMDVSYIRHKEATATETAVDNERDLQTTFSPTMGPALLAVDHSTHSLYWHFVDTCWEWDWQCR
jgi:hypothetical protein